MTNNQRSAANCGEQLAYEWDYMLILFSFAFSQ